jgi:hypothetical protein
MIRRHARRPGLQRPALAAGVALALAATALAAPPPADPSEFRYQPLPADGSVEVRIDASTPTFEFKPGRSPFRAFRLPDAGKPYVVEIRSLLDRGTDPARGRVFYPVAALLDDHFMVSRQTDLEALRFELPLFEDARAPAYRLLVGVDPAQGHERYLVVYTPAPLLAPRPSPEATTPEAAAEAARVAFAGAAPGGVLRITVRADGAPR